MNYMHYDELNISSEWFQMGKDKIGNDAADVAFRFIAYWIAFNSFYSKYSLLDSEREQIKDFITNKYDEYFSGIIDFNTSPELEVFKDRPVLKGSKIPSRNHFGNPNYYDALHKNIIDKNLPEKERFIALFLTIYQVRCNMFHGEKNPKPDRNYQLVDSSQKILEKVLKSLIEKAY